jgi:3-(3-hydroxy-phenyl)propionate hydroxylase
MTSGGVAEPAFDVAVVGLGPTGAVLANLCGQRGLRTVVFERSPDPHG